MPHFGKILGIKVFKKVLVGWTKVNNYRLSLQKSNSSNLLFSEFYTIVLHIKWWRVCGDEGWRPNLFWKCILRILFLFVLCFSSNSRYKRFITEYGTHYFSYAKMGGLLQMRTAVSKSKKDSMTETEIKVKVEASYYAASVSVEGGASDSSKSSSSSEGFESTLRYALCVKFIMYHLQKKYTSN